MSDYIVSARKYRPDTFESLIGQDNISRTLRNSIQRGQLAHAYLFCGPRGVGKTSAARIFAKTINCANPGPDMRPCGECESCKSFREGRSYCIHELDAASNNGVDDIKLLMDQVQIPPQTGKYSVYIIDEVHMLSTAAFNAFLKTLEEPPAHAIFILATTEKHKIIPTILSRCQTYDFNRISVPDIVRNLRDIATKENIIIDDESLHLIAQKADGAMRDALTVFDQTVAFCGTNVKYEDVLHNLNILDYEYSFRLVDAFLKGDYAQPMLIFDEVLRKGFNALYFVTALSSHLRDLLVSKTGGLEALLELPASLKSRYAEQAANCSVKWIYDALGVCSQCEAQYRASSNQRLHIEFSLMRLAFLGAAGTTASASVGTTGTGARVENSVGRPAGAAIMAAGSTVSVAEKVKKANTDIVEANSATAVSKTAKAQATESTAVKAEVSSSIGLDIAKESKGNGIAKKSGASLSLSSLLKDEQTQEADNGDATAVSTQSELPSEELMSQRWKELASMQTQTRLSIALLNASIEFEELDDKKLLRFFVSNEAQKKWIEEKILQKLEGDFCKLCACNKLRLEPAVTPDEKLPDLKYMPSEKAEELMKTNPEVKNLVAELALDLN